MALLVSLALGAMGSACIDQTDAPPGEDGIDDDVTDGKADVAGIQEGSPEAIGILRAASELDAETLRTGVGLTRRVARNIIDTRSRIGGFSTLAQLDRVPYVGPIAIERLLAYAEAHDLVPVADEPSQPPTPATPVDDPFDPASCAGPAITASDAQALRASAAAAGTLVNPYDVPLGALTFMGRERVCHGTACEWTTPVKATIAGYAGGGLTSVQSTGSLILDLRNHLADGTPGASIVGDFNQQAPRMGGIIYPDTTLPFRGTFGICAFLASACAGEARASVGSRTLQNVTVEVTLTGSCARIVLVGRPHNPDVEVAALVRY